MFKRSSLFMKYDFITSLFIKVTPKNTAYYQNTK